MSSRDYSASEMQQAAAARGLLMVRLVSAVYWFDEALQAGLSARGWSGVTRGQSLILANLASGVRRPAQLARNLGVSRQSMSQTLAEMEALNLVEIAPDPDDKRGRIVSFSPASAALRDDAMATLATIETTLADRLGPAVFEALKAAMAADWGPSPVGAVAAAAGAPLPPPPPRGRPRKVST